MVIQRESIVSGQTSTVTYVTVKVLVFIILFMPSHFIVRPSTSYHYLGRSPPDTFNAPKSKYL